MTSHSNEQEVKDLMIFSQMTEESTIFRFEQNLWKFTKQTFDSWKKFFKFSSNIVFFIFFLFLFTFLLYFCTYVAVLLFKRDKLTTFIRVDSFH